VTPVEVTHRASDDGPAIAALLAAAAGTLGHRPLDDDSWAALLAGRQSGFAGFVARAAPGAKIVGYAQVDRRIGSWDLAYVLDPAVADPSSVGRALGHAVLDLVRAEGGGHVRLWARLPTATNEEIASSLGLASGRDLYQMRRPLPLGQDSLASSTTRPFRVGQDEPAWLELNNRAFASHPDQGSWSPSTLAERERQPWFDPQGFLVHEKDGRMIAFCWTKVHEGDPPLGEIYVLGVDPTAQGHGLGGGMLRAGLAWLARKGLYEAMLYVDADNDRAVQLYREAGFVVDHADRAYVGQVAAAR
jgi:mycothiol synthase